MKLRRLAAVVSAAVLAMGMVSAVSATAVEKVTVCHAAGQAGTTHFVQLDVPPNEGGYPQGHFTENGTQEAGHEQDYLGPCKSEDLASQEPSSEPNCNTEQQDAKCPSDEPSSEPSQEASSEPSEEASTEPSQETTPSEEPSDGQVEALTSEPTLPPTDTMSGGSTSSPDSTLPLALIVLGIIGLSAVVLTPVRTRR